MPGNSPPEAIDHFLGVVRESLACITDTLGQYYPNPNGRTYVFTLLGEEILGPDGTDFRLSLTQNFSVREDDRENYGPYRVHTTKYIYELFDGEERVFGYHWHPDRTPDRQYPHFHLWAGATRLLSEQHDPHIPILRDAHIPTGRIAIEDVLWLLIADFHVHSYVTHWKKRLRKNRKSFEDWKSW